MQNRHFGSTIPVLVAAAATALALGAAPVAAQAKPAPPQATTTIRCEQTRGPDSEAGYDPPSASAVYDRRFSEGPTYPAEFLDEYTPQGVVFWKDWDGEADLLLVSAHNKGDTNSVLIGLDPRRPGKIVGKIALGPTHAGALGMNGDWVFVNGPNSGDRYTINAYRVADVRAELKAGGGSLDPAEQTGVYGASFLTVDGRHVYAGKHELTARDWMYRYTINGNGSLTPDVRADGSAIRWEIPAATQGVAKSGENFLFSTSTGRKNRANLYVTKASQTNLDKASPRCFRAPSMAQGIDVSPDGRVYLNFESGSFEFNGDHGEPAINVIPGLHTAKLSDLVGLPGGTLRLGTLHAQKQEDNLGSDEIAIRVEGQKLGKTIDIEEGQRKKVDTTVQFTGNAQVKLYEEDSPDPDDHLGTRNVKPGNANGILAFTGHGAHYRLSYTVKP